MKNEQEKKSASLHFWYISDKYGSRRAHGNVSGHPADLYLPDGTKVKTSPVEDIVIDYSKGEAIVTTQHTVYHCPLEYCDFEKQDAYPDVVPNYESVKSIYKGKISHPEIEYGKILIVLSNFNEYYFNSLCVKDTNGENYGYTHRIHVGMMQDSVLVTLEDRKESTPLVSLSYFPFPDRIHFYHTRLANRPLYIENIGSSELKIQISDKEFLAKPKERIQIA